MFQSESPGVFWPKFVAFVLFILVLGMSVVGSTEIPSKVFLLFFCFLIG